MSEPVGKYDQVTSHTPKLTAGTKCLLSTARKPFSTTPLEITPNPVREHQKE